MSGHRLHDQTRRSISRIFRMVALSLGITPSLYSIKEGRIPVGVTPRLHSHFTLAGLLRNGGRNQFGMQAGFPSERWPLSRRNGSRIRPKYAIVSSLVAERKFGFTVERALFLIVLHRLFISGSDRVCEKWRRKYRIDGAENIALYQLYRAMAFLGEEISDQKDRTHAPRCATGKAD
jgi:hypothetical protein